MELELEDEDSGPRFSGNVIYWLHRTHTEKETAGERQKETAPCWQNIIYQIKVTPVGQGGRNRDREHRKLRDMS